MTIDNEIKKCSMPIQYSIRKSRSLPHLFNKGRGFIFYSQKAGRGKRGRGGSRRSWNWYKYTGKQTKAKFNLKKMENSNTEIECTRWDILAAIKQVDLKRKHFGMGK